MKQKNKPVTQDDNKRNYKGQFKKGISGNPSGRAKTESAILREKLQNHADKVFDLLMDKLDEGDSAALKMCLDRLVPPLKAVSSPVRIEIIGDSLADKANAVFASASSGIVPPDIAAQLVTALSGVAKIEEATNLELRIKALEERTK